MPTYEWDPNPDEVNEDTPLVGLIKIPEGTPYDDLPVRIQRQCCGWWKDCGVRPLYKTFRWRSDRYEQTPVREVGYRRESNDDWYFGPYDTVEKLVDAMNNWEREIEGWTPDA